MKKLEVTTTDLAEFDRFDRQILMKLLQAWHESGLPDGFHDEEVRAMLNRMSGYVFITNSEYQVCMLNGDKLETWYNCAECGHEGFNEECQLSDNGCNECKDGG
jgi:hypothetical protein